MVPVSLKCEPRVTYASLSYLERLVANRVYDFFEKHNILSPTHYGFRANYSTQLALVDLVDKLSSALDNSLHTVGLFLDISKALDTIDHNILINKLHRYGVRGVALNWFKSYLSDRKVCCMAEYEVFTCINQMWSPTRFNTRPFTLSDLH